MTTSSTASDPPLPEPPPVSLPVPPAVPPPAPPFSLVPAPRSAAASSDDLAGPARVEQRGDRVLGRLTVGEVAVIDMIDIDLDTARALVARRPVAIVNGSTSATGRTPSLGPVELRTAGIRLVDDVGSHLLAVVDDGDLLTVTGDGRILRDGRQLAAGTVHDETSLARVSRQGRSGLGAQVAAFGACAPAVFDEERHLLVPPGAVEPALGSADRFPPNLRTLLLRAGSRGRSRARAVGARPAVVVMPGPRVAQDARTVTRFARRTGALVLAAGEGAQHALRVGLRPDVVLGDARVLPEGIVASASVVVHLSGPASADSDATTAADRLHRLGAVHAVWRTGLSVDEAATVLAVSANAGVVVMVGARRGLLEFAEQGPVGMAGAALTHAAWGHRLVDASVARRLIRPGPSWAQAVTVLLVGAGALTAAVVAVGNGLDASSVVGTVIDAVIDAVGSAVGAVVGERT